MPGAWDGFELAIRAVLGQQITVAAAAGLAGRLVAVHGERLAITEGNLTHVFPKSEVFGVRRSYVSRHADAAVRPRSRQWPPRRSQTRVSSMRIAGSMML